MPIYILFQQEPDKVAKVLGVFNSDTEAAGQMRFLQLQTSYEFKNTIKYYVQSAILQRK